MTYNFQVQLDIGEAAEKMLDAYFGAWYEITPATRQEQRQGIDRHYRERRGDRCLRVEYKTDYTARRTGNAFVETVSVDTQDKPGWAHTSTSDVLLYYIPGDELVYCIVLATLREQLPRWKREYPLRRVPNGSYHTHGLLVPLDEFEQCATQVISL